LSGERADLKGLPLIGEADCQAPAEKAKTMALISRGLRKAVRPYRGPSVYDNYYPQDVAADLAKQKKWLEDGLSTVDQMMQVDEPAVRMGLVEFLASVNGEKSGPLLARHALFDASPEVREKSIDALRKWPRRHAREVLLDGLRYPWPPIAAHAAEALVALDDRASIPRLTALLDEPDPREPVRNEDGKWVVKEVVRINHLRNCLLCHAPSHSEKDLVRGVVPKPGEPLPQAYYASREGDFVRADVTYLRQDFSLTERVAKPDKWPKVQRFDYVVRTRELTAEEAAAHEKKPRKPGPASYPQREAVLFALRELTGFDAGQDSAAWYELLWFIEATCGH
jgi:hypothetical protein